MKCSRPTVPSLPPIEGEPAKRLELDYASVRTYFLHLADVRFKLLAALPAVSVGALLVVPTHHEWQLSAGVVGLLVTMALGIYDQRNTQIYDRLVLRARCIEVCLGLLRIGGQFEAGGAFLDRPRRRAGLLWHDLALALAYSGSLAAWALLTIRALAEILDPEVVIQLAQWATNYAWNSTIPALCLLANASPQDLLATTASVGVFLAGVSTCLALAVANDLETTRAFDDFVAGLAATPSATQVGKSGVAQPLP